MAISSKHQWTIEKLAALSRAELEDLRDRAQKFAAVDLVAMCEEQLATKEEVRKRTKGSSTAKKSSRQFVIEYHFVCSRGRGVTEEGEGRFWSGSWKVSETNVSGSVARGAYLALHESKADSSYRQGKIVDFRKAPRDMIDKENEGIEFLVEETNQELPWFGSATGEKGYKWSTPADGAE